MSVKKIKQHNDGQFLTDLKKATSIMIFASKTENYFKTTKKEVLKEAERGRIKYYMTDEVFKVRRMVMVVF